MLVSRAHGPKLRRRRARARRQSPAAILPRDLLQLRPLRARPLSAPADAARVATDDR
ncbi:hypothetical protein D8O27_29180 [Burkholderia mallei]|uniref:Uncharacterized protein n=3 Tax=pseudomallei group TaxID=111527 RepID=A0AAX1XA19_BURML|nr:hypothetical protein BMAA0119 [Burkholderia mallei ATCC 23344]ABM48929.1 hypothetical protein BMASAVP1_1284 [Burkholderia mallei SAVP1]ABO01581.1 hypothetical protein BMA10247_A0143 [Burkholderia mallei NCTC 10247]AUL58852.1 hypothetical protein BHT10_23415 [Burkholderia pseudomallei]PNX05506.1 hypothetical protein CF649_05765 [Burkholderia sp. 136(2017)]PNX17932.1 hypothetical protein CF650_00730 [Burkholderia sp. 129]PNX32409.1 hypothetical protein CF647_05670 [Burkholderia sp. 117]PNX4